MKFTIITAIAFLLLVSSSKADPFTPEAGQMYNEALVYWQQEPTQCTEVIKELVPPGSLDTPDESGVIGRATQPPPGWYGPCEFKIVLACSCTLEVMEHEMGHLLGNGHSEDPNSIMYPSVKCTEPTVSPTVIKRKKKFGRNDGIHYFKRNSSIGDRTVHHRSDRLAVVHMPA